MSRHVTSCYVMYLNEWMNWYFIAVKYLHWRMCFERLLQAFARWQPGIFFDIAAQPILEYRSIDSIHNCPCEHSSKLQLSIRFTPSRCLDVRQDWYPMYYPEGMKARESPVQSIEPHRILAPTRDSNQEPPGPESRVVTIILPLHTRDLMSRHGTSCHVMSYHVMSRHVTSRHVTSCHVMSRHVTSCPVMSRHVISCYVISRRKSRDGHVTNASLSTDFFHTQSIQIKHDRVRWLSRMLPIQYRISGIWSSYVCLLIHIYTCTIMNMYCILCTYISIVYYIVVIVRTTEAEIQLPLRRLLDSSVSSLIRSWLASGKQGRHFNFFLGARIFFHFSMPPDYSKKLEKQHFLCSNLTLFIVPFFLFSLFLSFLSPFSFSFFFFFFFSFSLGGATAPSPPPQMTPLEKGILSKKSLDYPCHERITARLAVIVVHPWVFDHCLIATYLFC